MHPADALARYLWEQGLDVFTDPLEPPGHLVVREGDYTRIFSPGEVATLAAVLWGLGRMDAKGRPIGVLGEEQDPLPA